MANAAGATAYDYGRAAAATGAIRQSPYLESSQLTRDWLEGYDDEKLRDKLYGSDNE